MELMHLLELAKISCQLVIHRAVSPFTDHAAALPLAFPFRRRISVQCRQYALKMMRD
jgi:hypothetical protein